jgi:beta-phosphoglucomutase-like phosphatase (HAD superfamily)
VYAARKLGIEPASSAVVEDALVGVRAAKQGGFGLVVGIDRTEGQIDLAKSGADLVVTDLEMTLGIDNNRSVSSELGRSSHAE